ncbi:MAG: hypothetical protein GF397_04195 [Elusimicrobia bacterium]|nr:hypothetical protein [Elusimicrobiota bacterium]
MMSVPVLSYAAVRVPPLVNPQEYNSENELDMLQNFFHSDRIWSWLQAENGFRITGGSLNIRHIYHDRFMKIRYPLIARRLWFRYRHRMRERIDVQDQSNEIHIEYSPFDNWYCSLIGDPSYEKYDIDIGWSVRYGLNEAQSITLGYMLIDFDNNYAFHDASVNEGFERFYRTNPTEWRVKLVQRATPVSLWIEGLYQRTWTREYYDLNNTQNNYVLLGGRYEVEGELRYDRSPSLIFAVDFLSQYRRQAQWFIVPRSSEDHLLWEKRSFVHPKLIYRWYPLTEVECGLRFVINEGEDMYPAQPVDTLRFKNTNTIPFINSITPLGTHTSVELGYMYATIDEDRYENLVPRTELNIDNRIRLGIIIDFNQNTHLKIITGWDLDDEDVDRFQIFDGGFIQFQTAL